MNDRPRGDLQGTDPASHPLYPGEPGVETDARPPFVADHPTTRWLFALNRKGIRPGLKRIRGLLADLGHPERGLKTLVTAGTNGKGSTTRILARLLQDEGLYVACYTSPHLMRVYERLTLDDAPVDPDLFHDAVERVRPSVDRHEASWFETLTAVSILMAREAGVDVLCCETGLGGRLDASNALEKSAVLLTGVSLDHQHILGEDLTSIAAEKLGLLAADVPFFTAVTGELKSQAFAAAVAAGAPAHFLDELARIDAADDGGWRLTTRGRVVADLPVLGGDAMRRNAALALLALDELAERDVLPFPSSPAESLARTFLPGRYQRVLRDPDVVVDTAHNPEALEGVLRTFTARPCRGRRIVLFGGMRDKEPGEVVGEALHGVDVVHAAPVALPRSRNPEELQSLMDRWGLAGENGAVVHRDLDDALTAVARDAGPEDAVLVTGSCFMVADALWRLGYRDLEETRDVRPAGEVLGRFREEDG